jgi:hypothetical protein
MGEENPGGLSNPADAFATPQPETQNDYLNLNKLNYEND